MVKYSLEILHIYICFGVFIMIKLRRSFNLLNTSIWKELGFIFCGILVLFVILFFISMPDTDQRFIKLGVGVIVMFPIVVIVRMLFEPSKMFFDEKGVRFSVYHSIRVFGKNRLVKVDYDVIGLKDVEFSQNLIEKYFDVGHITFSGAVYFEAKRHEERIKPKTRFAIYGIPNFSRFIEEFPHK